MSLGRILALPVADAACGGSEDRRVLWAGALGLVPVATLRMASSSFTWLLTVPLLGLLFRRDVDRETRREIVVVIRPHVMSTPAEVEGLSRKLLQDLSKGAGAIPATPADSEPPRRPKKV